MSTLMAFHLALLFLLSTVLLRLLLALCLTRLRLLLALRLTLGLVLMLVLMAEATSNRQGVLINRQFNIFRSHPWKRNIHLIAILCLTNVHRCQLRCCARHHIGSHKALFE